MLPNGKQFRFLFLKLFWIYKLIMPHYLTALPKEPKPIDLAISEIKLLKEEVIELKREIKKINIKLKAKESVAEDKEYAGGWFW